MASIQTTELLVPYATPGGTYTVSILLPILALMFVGLRIYTRILQKTPLGVDDWLMMPALAFIIGMGITLIVGIHSEAIAYPTPYEGDLSPEERLTAVNPTIKLMGEIQYAFILLMTLAFGFIKLSIAYFYRRLFVTSHGSLFDWATRISVAVVIMWTITFFFGFVFSCGTHFSANWGSVQDAAYCTGALDLTDAYVVSDLVTNIVILCLPLPVIWNLHMTNTRKLLVIGILATGTVSIVATIIKVMISYEITNAGFNTHVDPDLTVSTILYWSMIEAGLAIIATCLPTLRFLVGKVSLDSIVNSVRSAISLHSIRSQRSQPSIGPSAGPYLDLHGNAQSGLHPQMAPEKGYTESFALRDGDLANDVGDGIHVTKQFYHHHSEV